MSSVMKTVARWVFILCLPVLLVTASISLAVNSGWLYRYGFETYGISRVTGLAESELERAAGGLIDYFNSGEEFIDLTVTKGGKPFQLFNEREVVHLQDVRGLIRLGYGVLLGTLAYGLVFAGVSLFWWHDRRRLARGMVGGGGLALLVMVALAILILFDFDRFFLQFHLLSFANDFWMLDPTRDYLIMLFPRGFWFDAAMFCAVVTAALALALGGAGWYLKRKN